MGKKFSLYSVALIVTATLLIKPFVVFGITIDDFISANSQIVATLPGESKAAGASSEFALGGTRVVKAEAFGISDGVSDLTASISQGRFASSQDVDVKGRSTVEWDATSDTGSSFFGLGGIDLGQDGANSFLVVVKQQDLPVNIAIEVFDTQGAPGSHGSTLTIRSQSAVPPGAPITLQFPFSSFIPIGQSAGADFSRVGLLRLIVDGSADSDVDIQIDKILTNGKCPQTPTIGGKVIDQCGVCAGDNSSCADCKGIPNGAALPGSACSTGNTGVCSSGTYNQSCVCDAPYPFDRCGICGGDGKSCISCSETNQTALLTALDGGAKRQERAIRAILRELKVASKSKATLRYIDSTQKRTHKLQLRNWTLSWMLPKIARTCDKGGELCASTSNAPVIAEYRLHAQELLAISIEAGRRLKVAKRKLSALDNGNIKKAHSLYTENLKNLDKVPVTQYACF